MYSSDPWTRSRTSCALDFGRGRTVVWQSCDCFQCMKWVGLDGSTLDRCPIMDDSDLC